MFFVRAEKIPTSQDSASKNSTVLTIDSVQLVNIYAIANTSNDQFGSLSMGKVEFVTDPDQPTRLLVSSSSQLAELPWSVWSGVMNGLPPFFAYYKN